MDAEGVGRERAAAAAPGDKTLADAGGLDSAQARSREPRALAEERRWGPVGTPAIRAPRADDPPPGCRCRQWRTMAPEEGRGAAARADTTCSRSTLCTKWTSRLPRGAGHGACGGDPGDNRAAMAASGTS